MISSAATLFYGRRSRFNRTFDDLDPHSSSSSSSSSSNSGAQNNRHRKNHHHRRRRSNHHPDDTNRSFPPFTVLHPFDPSSIPANELPQGCINESPLQNILNREATLGLSRRHVGSCRLPGPVLLARERLLQRLRGGSASEVRESGETSASSNHSDTILTELPIGANHPSVPQGPSKRPPGLTTEIISQLHHEVFLESQIDLDNYVSKTSKDCSICLENFVEGNELIRLHCGHRFHAKCLHPWLQSCGECPYCRSHMMTS